MATKPWSKKVHQVFNVEPRNGNDKTVLWLTRHELETTIDNAILIPQKHICVDGATGTGKSSLVITSLSKNRIRNKAVQITHDMDWTELCKNIIEIISNKNRSTENELEIGIENALPKIGYKRTFIKNSNKLGDIELKEKICASTTEHDIAGIMCEENYALVLDDFEKANDGLVLRIVNLMKLLIQSFKNDSAKIIIIGIDDIFRKIINNDVSLDDRLFELTVGTLSHEKNEPIAFLYKGFDSLGLDFVNSKKLKEMDQEKRKKTLEIVIDYIYKAADGLPKSLNELAQRIVLKKEGFKSISQDDIINECKYYLRQNFNKYSSQFPGLIQSITNNPVTYEIIKLMYKNDIGKKHLWVDISLKIGTDHGFSENDINHAINTLLDLKFITRTGYDNEVIFVKNPSFAHLLGIFINYPEDLNLKGYNPSMQLELPLFSKK